MSVFASPNIVNSGLIYYLDASNIKSYPGSGTTWINLAGGSNGTLTNGPSFSSDYSGSIGFDGANDYISIPYDLSWNNTNSVTIIMYLRPSSLSSYFPFIGKGPSGWEWQLMQKNTSLQFVYWNTDGVHTNGPIPEISNFFTSTSEFVCLCMVWNHVDNKYYFYRNATLVDTVNWVNASINQNTSGGINIGGNIYIWNASGGFWPGRIANTQIYDRALSASEVLQNYNATKSRFIQREFTVTNGLVLHLDAANRDSYKSGTTWRDLSGNGNNGTLTNGPVFKSSNGGCIVLDGVDDYVNLPTFTTDLGNSTTSFWVKFNELDKYFLRISAGVGYYQWYVWADGKLQFEFSRSTPSQLSRTIIGSTGDVTTNVWYNLVVTISSTTNCFMYRNTIQIGSTSLSSGSITPSGVRRIGSYTSGSINSNFAITQIYNRALSAAEVLQNFNATKSRFGL